MRALTGLLAVCVAGVLLVSAPAYADGPEGPQEPVTEGPCANGAFGSDFTVADLRRWLLRHANGWQPSLTVTSQSIRPNTLAIGQHHDLLANPADSRGKLTAVGADYDMVLAGAASITEAQAVALFELDLAGVQAQIRALAPGFDQLGSVRQAVLIDMVYYRGIGALTGRPALLSALAAGDYTAAGLSVQDYAFWYPYYDTYPAAVLMRDGFTCETDPGHMPTGSPWQPTPAAPDLLQFPPADPIGQNILAQILAGQGGGYGETFRFTVAFGSGCSADVHYGATIRIVIDCGSFAVEVQVFQP